MDYYKRLLKAAFVRAIKTFAQSFCALITVDAATGVGQIDWGHIASVATVSLIYSLMTSVAGLPEVGEE